MPVVSTLLAWLDLETTGLNHECDELLEVACVITDGRLNILDVGPRVLLKPRLLPEEGSFVWDMHMKNGLLHDIDTFGISLGEGEKLILDFLNGYDHRGLVPMAGSSVHFDRRMLSKWMPSVEDWFHYRNVDVSSFKEMFMRWCPEIALARPQPEAKHRAESDIYDSIGELKYYMKFVHSKSRRNVLRRAGW